MAGKTQSGKSQSAPSPHWRGKVSLPADPRITDGKVPNIHIATVGHPDVVADLDIGLRSLW